MRKISKLEIFCKYQHFIVKFWSLIIMFTPNKYKKYIIRKMIARVELMTKRIFYHRVNLQRDIDVLKQNIPQYFPSN